MSRTIKALVVFTLACIAIVFMTGALKAEPITLGQLKDVHSHAYWAYKPSSAKVDLTPYTYVDMTRVGVDREYAMCSDLAFTLFVNIKDKYPETIISIYEVYFLKGRYEDGFHAIVVVSLNGKRYVVDLLFPRVKEFDPTLYRIHRTFSTVQDIRKVYD